MFQQNLITRESALSYAAVGFLVLAGISGFASAYRLLGWGEGAVAAVNAVFGFLALTLAVAIGWLLVR